MPTRHSHHDSCIDSSKLWVVTPLSNPQRYRSRYELYNQFKGHVLASGANLMTVEVALGHRAFESIDGLHLRTHYELWQKENQINLGIARLPPDWQYVAWIDADVEFMRADWVKETVHQLQHYPVIQMRNDIRRYFAARNEDSIDT